MNELRALGSFKLWPDEPRELIIPNNIVLEGKTAILKMAFRDDQTDVASGANYYLGLGNFVYAVGNTLASITEVAVSHGYARQAVSRDGTGWPTMQQIQNAMSILTLVVNFAASGGTIGPFNRLFLCTASAGTTGKLISVSSALATPITITDGQSIPVQYQLYLN